MRSYVLLGCIVALTIVSSVRSETGYHTFIASVPEAVRDKCFVEADLVADKDKVLTDEKSVDPTKLSCYTACTLREGGVLVEGKIMNEVLKEQVKAIYAKDPDSETRTGIIQECVDAGASGTTDCEKVASLTTCILGKLAEKGLQ